MSVIVEPSPLFLTPSAALQVSRGSGTAPHRHTAAQIIVSLEHQLSFRLYPSDAFSQSAAVLVPPNVLHHIAGPDPLSLMIWLDPATSGARAMRQYSESTVIPIFNHDTRLPLQQIKERCLTLKTSSDAQELIAVVVQLLVSNCDEVSPLDERILFVLSEMKQQPRMRLSHPLSQLAQKVNLSESRLRHLFRKELGVPLQQYWIGYRLLAAIRQMRHGDSLTEVAYSAGFSDLSHFSKAFRASFGVPPSFAQKDSHFVQASFPEC
ncbi:MAG: helix-turn-helix domain-containing protein [Phormidesmis sp.]